MGSVREADTGRQVACLLFSSRECFVRLRGSAVCVGVGRALVALIFEHDETIHALLATEAMEQVGDDLAHL